MTARLLRERDSSCAAAKPPIVECMKYLTPPLTPPASARTRIGLCLSGLLALPVHAVEAPLRVEAEAPPQVVAEAASRALAEAPPPQIVVSATRTETPAFDVPASIDRIGAGRDRAGVNLSERLGGVPGLMARDRQNFAQDTQLSVRGFGARASFGIRGVRLYVDGIPATMPDGQGQISHVDLNSAERIEVLRGPFSALYGNSSGGVLQVFTEDGAGAPFVQASAVAGSDGLARTAVKAGGSFGAVDLLASSSRFRTDGYRAHSAAERTLANARLGWRLDESTRVTLVANHVDLPRAQDPLGLTRAQADANPRAVDPVAERFDTRKTTRQSQAGVVAERRLDSAALRLMLYAGERATEQFQAIPVAPQASPLHPGGVIQLDRRYQGADLRWTGSIRLGDGTLQLVAGLAHDRLDEDRRGRQNFIGSTLGVEGALRRDEHNRVRSTDPYAQASWQFAPAWTAHAGLRRSSVRFESKDAYVAGPNPDDSGGARYSATLPVMGLMFAASPSLHLYATAGKGFETPTLNELSYRPNGATGLNFALQPAKSDNVELGAKWRDETLGRIDAALFETRTENEIVTLASAGGRTTFRNADGTRRRGAELQWSAGFGPAWRAQAAATWLDAVYRGGAAAGLKLPGVAPSALYAALQYAPPQGWRAAIDLRALGRVMVNDANTDAAAAHALLGASLGYTLRSEAWEIAGFVRGDNLAERRVIGSVIVNEANGRFFEPAPGRTWTAGLSGRLAF
jgi:iron complex outermembrane receptor protein